METFVRLSLGAGLLGALIAGGSSAYFTWSARLGLNLTEWLDIQQRLEEEGRRRDILSYQSQQLSRNLEAKCRVLEDLRDHRLTLLEAAARFRALGCPGPENNLKLFRLVYPGQTDEERWCRQVIGFLRGADSNQSELASLVDEFEAELTQHLAKGSLHLPD